MSGFTEAWDPSRPGAAAGAGRSAFSEALATQLCAAVAAGGSVRAFCRGPGRPHRATVANWRRAHPDFDAAMREAARRAKAAQRLADRTRAQARRELLAQAQAVRTAAGQPGGKPSAYTPEIGAAVCARLEAGESLTSIGADPAMPSYGAVLKWVKTFPEFEAMYVAARQVQGDWLFDEARDVARGAAKDDVARARLQFDVIRWQAARLAPRKYLEPLVAAEGKAEIVADGEAAAPGPDDGPMRVVFSVMRFEKGPNGTVLCAPPRDAEEAQAWIDATGEPYRAGVGPNGELRPPMDTPQDWAERDALIARMAARRRGR